MLARLAALENWNQSSWAKFRVSTLSVILYRTLLHPETLNFTWMLPRFAWNMHEFCPPKSFLENLVWSSRNAVVSLELPPTTPIDQCENQSSGSYLTCQSFHKWEKARQDFTSRVQQQVPCWHLLVAFFCHIICTISLHFLLIFLSFPMILFVCVCIEWRVG